MNTTQTRRLYALLLIAVMLLGLASRTSFATQHLPIFISLYIGDTLWALLIFLAAVILFPSLAPPHLALIALSLAFTIEFSQLYRAPWLNTLRATALGGLILGHGFLFSDLICYTVGILIGMILDYSLRFPYQSRNLFNRK